MAMLWLGYGHVRRTSPLPDRRCARDRDRLVDLRGVAADANGAHDFTVHDYGHTALQWCGVGKRKSRNSTGPDLLFEIATGSAVDRGGSCLADSDVDTRDLGGVHARQFDDGAAAVDDDDMM